MAQNRIQRRGNSTSTVHGTETKDQMIKALKAASYVIPVGMGLNAVRLAYKGFKAGKTAIGLAKQGQQTVKAASQARKNKLITAGEQRSINREAALRAQRAADRAKAAKTKAAKAEGKAVGATVAGTAAGLSLKSKTKTTGTTTTTKSATPTINKPKVAASPNTGGGSIGRTSTSTTGKARVATKPTSTDKKKNKYGKSGMGMAAYQSRTGSRR